jgi:hypothetical protein
MVRIIEDLGGDWRRLDERIEGMSNEIEAIARQDAGCERLMSVPGIGPIISSAMVAAIGAGDVFTKGRDFAAWLGLVPKQISTGDRTILGKYPGSRNMRAVIDGRLPPNLTAKDIILAIIGEIGAAGGIGHAFEFSGEAIRALSMEGRMTLCSMSVEAGARTGDIHRSRLRLARARLLHVSRHES